MEMDVVVYEQSNQTIFVMEAQHHRLIHALLAQLDYRQMLQKHRVLQLAETANERVLKLAMTEIRQVETDVVQAVLLTETTILDSTKKAVGMVKELSTTRTET